MFSSNFINRQFYAIKKGGKLIFFRKILTIIKTLFLIPIYLFVLPSLILVYFVRPLFLIRFGYLFSSRFGHFVMNTEYYLSKKELGINFPAKSYLDLFCYREISNRQVAIMWKREINILPEWFIMPFVNTNNFLKKFFPSCKLHDAMGNLKNHVDIHDSIDKTSKHLKFTDKEKKYGYECLEKFGVSSSDKFICLDVRDQSFLDYYFPEKDWSYHSIRNVELDNFVFAAEEMANRGYFVFRMGKKASRQLKSSNNKIIDYANSKMRSDFLDVFLGANCAFYLGSGSGYASVPYIFRRPIAQIIVPLIGYTNSDDQPEEFFNGFTYNSLILTKHHICKKTKKELSLNEIFSNKVAFSRDAKFYSDKGVVLQDPTAEEIKDMADEMADIIENKWELTQEDKELQKRFYEIFEKNINSDFFKSQISENLKKNLSFVGKFRGRISTKFLRNNSSWLS